MDALRGFRLSELALVNYMDGVAVPDTMYGLYGHNGADYTVQNSAIPTLSSLRFEMDSYAFDDQPIVLGARAGFDREFGGALAGFRIFPGPVTTLLACTWARAPLSRTSSRSRPARRRAATT